MPGRTARPGGRRSSGGWPDAPFPVPSPEQLREAFLWAEYRVVRKDATIKLFGGAYETDPVLAGRRVECVFDPFDLAVVEVCRRSANSLGGRSRNSAPGPGVDGAVAVFLSSIPGGRSSVPGARGHRTRRAAGGAGWGLPVFPA